MKKPILTSLKACSLLMLSILITQGCSKNEIAVNKKSGPQLSGKKGVNTFNAVPNGTYSIYNSLVWPATTYNRVVEAAGGSTSPGTLIQQNEFGQWNGQNWKFTYLGLGCYKIMDSQDTTKSLTTGVVGSQCTLQTYTGAANQLFIITTYAPYGLSTVSPASNYNNGTNGALLTLDGGSTNDLTKITLTAQSGSMGNSTQYWYFLNNSVPVDNTTPTKTITWSASAPVQLSYTGHANARYGRILRIDASNLLLTYQYNNTGSSVSTAIRLSSDNGSTWGTPQTYLNTKNFDGVASTGAQTCLLANGDIIMAYSVLASDDSQAPPNQTLTNPNSHDNISIIISHDKGVTWSSTPQVVARGRSWEPDMIQLPGGEIELFYSSEQAWTGNATLYQRILMIRSTNNGATWTSPQVVSYTANQRDGMPVPVILQNNYGTAFSIETPGVGGATPPSPSIVWSSPYSDWHFADSIPTTTNGRRWVATPTLSYGGEPFLIQLPAPATETILQSAVTATATNAPVVSIGNSVCKNFTHASYPWTPLPTGTTVDGWGSLFLKNSTTIMSLESLKTTSTGAVALYWQQGTVNP